MIEFDKVKILESAFKYETELSGVDNDIRVRGKLLEDASREHASLLYFYESRRAELKIMVDFVEHECERIHGRLYKDLITNNNRDLSHTAILQYIKAEKAYIDIKHILLTVQEIYGKYTAVTEAFKARGYMLNNIAKVRASNVPDSEI